MILTITTNPAVDIQYQLDQFVLDHTNRCQTVMKSAGGKGLNVSRVIRCANEEVLATGFLGGRNGQFIIDQLNTSQIQHQFVSINDQTRNCIAIIHEGMQTEILEDGPTLTDEEVVQFMDVYDQLLMKTNVIVVSGSVPKKLGDGFYRTLIEKANACGKKFLLDTSGRALQGALAARPYLIKPNQHELAQLLGRKVETLDDIMSALSSIKNYQIPYIVVSLGEKGAIALHDNVFYRIKIPKIHAMNAVGSGDATMAGFAIAIQKNEDPETILRYGCTFGTLNALEKQTGFINPALIEAYFEQVKVERF